MAIYAISDLHLGFSINKSMDKFGENWKRHYQKIIHFWESKITSEDLILLPGDLSWAMKFADAVLDLNYIKSLEGKKVLLKGNHDYWWQSPSKMQKAYPSFHFMQNNSYIYKNEVAICGTKGSTCPGSSIYTKHDEKLYKREVQRLEVSLKSIGRNVKHIIVMLHYPPTNEKKEPSLFTNLIKEYNVNQVVYGHLHNDEYFNYSIKGMYNNIFYQLVSADYLHFNPIKIYES